MPIDPRALSRLEALTAEFYEWEMCGRGWQMSPRPVRLEPAFRPFWGHGACLPRAAADDGRKPTLASSLLDHFRHWLSATPHANAASPTFEEASLHDDEDNLPIVELALSVPRQQKTNREAAERFLLGLSCLCRPVAFEIIADHQDVSVQLACRKLNHEVVAQQLRAYFPGVAITARPNSFDTAWAAAGAERLIIEFGLGQEFMRPIAVFGGFEVDPLAGVIEAMSELRGGELAAFQVLFQPAAEPWAPSVLRAITDGNGRCFFADAPEMLRLAEAKVASPLFAAVIRLAVRSPDEHRLVEIAAAVAGALGPFSAASSNELIPLAAEELPLTEQEADLVSRRSHRAGMILNSGELVGLVHLPSASVECTKLTRRTKRTKTAPTSSLGHELVLGQNLHIGSAMAVSLSPSQRLRHTHVIGASGTGKSTLLLNLAVQDMENGHGLAVFDPHGDLIDQVISRVPERRIEDVVLFDSSDEEYSIGFNILSAKTPAEKSLLASDLVGIFRQFSTSWGDQMTAVLGNAIAAFLENPRSGTIGDLKRFLVEAEFRREFLQGVQDDHVVYFWQKEFPTLVGRPQAPLLTRLDAFLRPQLVRRIVCQTGSSLDLAAMLSEGKVLLCKLAHGAIGEENAYLLGSLLVSKIHQAAVARQGQVERRPFYLYIDEFQHFLTPSVAAMLTGIRKYGVGLILAHQELRQLGARDAAVLQAVLANPCTRICFRVGDEDARRLADGFATFAADDLQNLGVGEAIGRIEQAQHDFNLQVPQPPDVEKSTATARRQRIVDQSRTRYGRQVERAERQTEPACGATPQATRSDPVILQPTATRAERRTPVRPRPAETVLPGRGGPQHKYLQHIITQLAQQRGFLATTEKSILEGHGCVDVAIESPELKIACEISVTSTPEQEVANVRKCLAAGFDQVVVIGADERGLKRIQSEVIAAIDDNLTSRVYFLALDGLIAFLDERAVRREETVVAGRRVSVNYPSHTTSAPGDRQRAISEVIAKSIRRMRVDKHDPSQHVV